MMMTIVINVMADNNMEKCMWSMPVSCQCLDYGHNNDNVNKKRTLLQQNRVAIIDFYFWEKD